MLQQPGRCKLVSGLRVAIVCERCTVLRKNLAGILAADSINLQCLGVSKQRQVQRYQLFFDSK
jgi:hypothetical protein